MKQKLVNARITFHTAPIHVLERFTFKDRDSALARFMEHSGLDECVIVQTCNRVELFGASPDFDAEKIKKTWASLAGLEKEALEEVRFATDGGVLEHLLRLTSGLDSMVIGEEQILGQIKESITASRSVRASGEKLNTLFDKAIRIGVRIRNSTGISQGGISVGSMAVKLAEENIDGLKSKKILIIGTGEVSTLVAKSLGRRGYGFDVTSRTLRRSQAFCETMGGRSARFEDVLGGFNNYDVLFVATTAPYFLVTYDRIVGALKERAGGMMILDLSNPRTVDEKVATLGGIKLMNLDQIAEMVDKNMRNRMNKVKTVESIINDEIPTVNAVMNRLDAEPIVKDVFKSVDSLRKKELQKALQMLGSRDAGEIKIIEDLTKAIIESTVSVPMNNLRKASEQGDSQVVNAASRLFDYKKESD